MLSARAWTQSIIAAGSGRSKSVQTRDLARAISNSSNASRRSIRKLLLPLLKMASCSEVLVADSVGCWRSGGELFFLPRFIFQRTLTAKPRIEVGIFGGIDGNDLGGIRGITEFLCALNAHPAIGREYRLWLYPLCDPLGYVNHARAIGSNLYPGTEIWKDSDEPVAQLIEKELCERRFDGVISLRGNSQATQLQAGVSGQDLDFGTSALIAAQEALRVNQRADFAGFSVRKLDPQESIHACSGQSHKRFEIALEVPGRFPPSLQGEFFLVSLHAILAAYRRRSSERGSELLNL